MSISSGPICIQKHICYPGLRNTWNVKMDTRIETEEKYQERNSSEQTETRIRKAVTTKRKTEQEATHQHKEDQETVTPLSSTLLF